MTGPDAEGLKPKASVRKGEIIEVEIKIPIPMDRTAEELFENWSDEDESE